jgi:N-formylmaleamate deformylase
MKTKLAIIALLVTGCALPDEAEPTAAALHASCARSFGVEVSGHGSPMVLIPGLASPGEVWQTTVEHYRRKHRLHVLTLSGFAGRPATSGPVQAALIDTVVRELIPYVQGLAHPIVVGHSVGGVIALALAARAPAAVGRLVIVDALPYLPAAQVSGATPDSMRPFAAQLRQSLADMTPDQYTAFVAAQHVEFLVTSPSDAQLINEWMLASSPLTIGQALYDIYVTDLRASLVAITAPTLVIGTGDPTTNEPVFREQYAALPGVTVVMAPHARHFVMLDDPLWLWMELDTSS